MNGMPSRFFRRSIRLLPVAALSGPVTVGELASALWVPLFPAAVAETEQLYWRAMVVL